MVVVLQSSINVLGFGVSEQAKSCMNSINKIDTLQQFDEEFAPNFLELSKSADEKDLVKCLNTHSDPIDDVKNLKLAIVMGKEEDVCNYNYVRMVLARYHDTTLKKDVNHNLRKDTLH